MIRFIILILFFCNFAEARKPASYSASDLDKLWNATSNDKNKLITSNSVHFWAWSSNEASKYLSDYLSFTGAILADPHPRNIFDYHGKNSSFAVADIDDSGDGPLFLDFARFVVFLETSEINLKKKDILESYLQGLKENAQPAPAFAKKALTMDHDSIISLHEKWVDKVTHKNEFDFEKLDLQKKKSLTKNQKSEIASLEQVVLEKSELRQVFDVGFKVNDSGSSAGMSRFWFLVGNDKATRIYEFKEITEPAASYYSAQDSYEKRIASAVRYYSDGFDKKELSLVKTNTRYYWMRLKHIQLIDLDNAQYSKQDLKDFSLFMANWIGIKQSKQKNGKALLKKIEETDAKANLESFVSAYLSEVDRLDKKY